jgi:hypothetical protein
MGEQWEEGPHQSDAGGVSKTKKEKSPYELVSDQDSVSKRRLASFKEAFLAAGGKEDNTQ